MQLPMLLTAFLLALTIPLSSAASDFGTKEFSGLFPVLVQISDENQPTDTELQHEIDHVTGVFSAIAKELDARTSPPPEAFRVSIDAYREQLRTVLDTTSHSQRTALLKEIGEDADIKRHYLVDTSGFSAFDRPLLVTVSVATYRGKNEEPGYTVTCNPFRDASKKGDARFPFASETNHASLDMPPGHYRLQIYKGQKLILSRDILIGLSSKQLQEVRIDVSNY
ncbi:hypothetical protein [Paraburkholderia caribensis]|uniref:hypothetical protein n=1 Tax=Paraburkholderia caribensis TaxID=75105 RepID=UPI0034D1EF5D